MNLNIESARGLSYRVLAYISLVVCASYSQAEGLEFSDIEQAWLKHHPVVSMCVDPDWMPYEKLDAQGVYSGLVAEYMAIFQSRLGIRIEPMQADSWADSQKLYREGACDIVSALNKTEERAQYLDFTEPYITSPAVLVLSETNKTDKMLADLSGKTLAMVKGYVYEDKLRTSYPGIAIVYAPNMAIALRKVSTGEVDATLGPLFLSFSLIQEMRLDMLKVVGNTEYKDELRIGIKKGDPVMAGLFGKVVASLTPADNVAVRRVRAMQDHGSN